jgi:ubiquinone biosynthesis protein UbiJ
MLILETVINHYMALDPEMQDKLAAFRGKVIKLEMKGLNKEFYLFPGDDGMQVKTEYDGTADTVLSGSPASLFKMSMVPDASGMLLKGEVEISGDTRLGHQFKNIFTQMDIDWSEQLARLVGDSAAYQLQQSGKKLVQWGKQAVNSVAMTTGEYLQEESRDVVTETELEIFCEAVDRLRDDVDRLQAKIQLLSKQGHSN